MDCYGKDGAAEALRNLPENVQNLLIALKKDMEANGPIRTHTGTRLGPAAMLLKLPRTRGIRRMGYSMIL